MRRTAVECPAAQRQEHALLNRREGRKGSFHVFDPFSVALDANRGVDIAPDLVGVGGSRDALGDELLPTGKPDTAHRLIKPKAQGASPRFPVGV